MSKAPAMAVTVGALIAFGGAAACYAYADHEALRHRIRELLVKTLPLLRVSGVTHFVSFGTLLGHIREGDVIQGDTDGDVCVMAEDRYTVLALKSKFRKVGVEMEVCGDYLVRLRDSGAPYAYIDLYLMDHDVHTGVLGERLWGSRDRSLVFPATLTLPPRPSSFLGVDTFVPAHPELWLSRTYGESWRTPRRHDKGTNSKITLARAFGIMNVFILGLSQLVHGK